MTARTAIFLFSTLLLCGCSSLNSLLETETPPPAPSEAVPPAPARASNDEWCRRVAASERNRMQPLGYDAATLDRMTQTAYLQCRATAQ